MAKVDKYTHNNYFYCISLSNEVSMNQLIKELKQLRERVSIAIITLLKILIFAFTKLKLNNIPIVAKFVTFSHNAIGVLEQYIPMVDKELKLLRQKNSKNRHFRVCIGIIFFSIGIIAVFSALFASNDSFFLKLFDDNIFYVFGFSIVCCVTGAHLSARRYFCPVCYCEKGIILDSKNTGSKSHYENWSIKYGNGWREEYSNKVGTTNYYKYLLKCTCCGHISEFNRKEFSRR